jgi:type I restriction enzyme, S subunit
MFATKVCSNELGRRLDPKYYSPELLQLKNIVETAFESSTFGKVCNRMNSGPFGSALHASNYVSRADGILFVRPQDCKEFIVNTDNDNVYIGESDHNRLRSSQFSSGAIIITKIGNSIGEMSVVPPSLFTCNISGNAMGAVLKEHDPYFSVSYLRSKYGQAEVQRGLSGGSKPKIDMTSISDITFPIIDSTIQKYIGDKVRQAEELKAWSKEIHKLAQEQIPNHGKRLDRYNVKSFRSKLNDLSELRLDASFYHPSHIELDEKLKIVGCTRLGKKCKQIKTAWIKNTDNFAYFEIGGLDISNGTIAPELIKLVDAPSRAKTAIKQGDILVSTVRPNRKNIAFVSQDYSTIPMVATSGFSVLRFSSLEDAALFNEWLRTDDATNQLMRWNSGSAYPAIDDDVPLNMFVPDFDSDFSKYWGERLLSSHYGLLFSKKLMPAAKLLVEALIEGKLTEQQIIHAQQALNVGDNSQDRDILSRLTTQGFEADGEPLFPDLDQLYDLLEKSQLSEE